MRGEDMRGWESLRKEWNDRREKKDEDLLDDICDPTWEAVLDRWKKVAKEKEKREPDLIDIIPRAEELEELE